MTDMTSATQGATEKLCNNGRRYRNDLTADRLRELLSYNEVSGEFRWRLPYNGAMIGSVADTYYVRGGYRGIRIDNGPPRLAHRLAWVWMTGEEAPCEVDHIDRDPARNAWSNLRLAQSRSQNQANTGPHRDSAIGIKGVSRDGSKYRAQIMIEGKYIGLGSHETPLLAWAPYADASRQHFGKRAYVQDEAEVRRLSAEEMSRRASEQQQQLPLVDAPSTQPAESLDHETV
jgi:hypothetical protein